MRELTDHEKRALAVLRVQKGVKVITLTREMVAVAELLKLDAGRPYEKVMVEAWKTNGTAHPGKDLVEHFKRENLVMEALEAYPDLPCEERGR